MKPALLSLLVVYLFFLSCKKEHPDLADQIIGKWELRAVYGGRGGTTRYDPGNGDIKEFGRTTYTRYYPNTPTRSGTYRLVRDTSFLDKQVRDFILYDNSTRPLETVAIREGKLYFDIDAADGGGEQYERIH